MSAETGSTTTCTIEEAATLLSIKPEQVHDILAAGALVTTGSGDALRVTRDSLLLYTISRLSQDVKQVTARPGGLAVAAGAFLPLLVVAWFMMVAIEVFSVRSGKPIAPVPAAVAVLAAVLALLWWLGRQADDFSSFNGAGTTLYGRRLTPEGRVGTQWLVFAGIPLLPIRSYVILEAGDVTSNGVGVVRKRQYRLRTLERIHWPQALPILAGVWLANAALVAFAVMK